MWNLGWLDLESVALIQIAQPVWAHECNCQVMSRRQDGISQITSRRLFQTFSLANLLDFISFLSYIIAIILMSSLFCCLLPETSGKGQSLPWYKALLLSPCWLLDQTLLSPTETSLFQGDFHASCSHCSSFFPISPCLEYSVLNWHILFFPAISDMYISSFHGEPSSETIPSPSPPSLFPPFPSVLLIWINIQRHRSRLWPQRWKIINFKGRIKIFLVMITLYKDSLRFHYNIILPE